MMMRIGLFLVLLGFSVLTLSAEDWTTSDGKTYKDVKVVSHDDAYVTILHDDGGGRVLLATLNPDLQKRFGYDPVKAAAAIAAVASSDQSDKDALAQEKAQSQAQAVQGQAQVNQAVADASVPPPPADASQSTQPQTTDTAPPTDSSTEPTYGTSTQIDDNGYGYYGGYGGYGGYGYGYGIANPGVGYSRGGYRSMNNRSTTFYGRHSNSSTGTTTANANTQRSVTQPAGSTVSRSFSLGPGVTAAGGFGPARSSGGGTGATGVSGASSAGAGTSSHGTGGGGGGHR